ncbi:hypothetical protein HanRHA438_Chr01g0042921 [Helianthus annuus]|nr:hypothetical protein HanIR_Chr01g0046701 [Helianthus annuus]KAJ0949836.1 hypothetical protein HanRHA438_Chr01g0042921 [Helianthus annuus]
MGYEAGLGRGLAENAQATTQGGLGFGGGPKCGSLKPGVGWAILCGRLLFACWLGHSGAYKFQNLTVWPSQAVHPTQRRKRPAQLKRVPT